MARVIFRFLCEWVASDDLFPLRRAADDEIGRRPQSFSGLGLQQAFQFSGGPSRALEDNIAALQQRFHVGEPQVAEQIAQVGHGDQVVAADVDPTQEGNVNGHK